jgi:uncharacterized protein YqhQ
MMMRLRPDNDFHAKVECDSFNRQAHVILWSTVLSAILISLFSNQYPRNVALLTVYSILDFVVVVGYVWYVTAPGLHITRHLSLHGMVFLKRIFRGWVGPAA